MSFAAVIRRLAQFVTAMAAIGLIGSSPSLAAADQTAGNSKLLIVERSIERGVGVAAMPTRVALPLKGKNLPVIVFSHGAYSSKDDYAPIIDHWAANGYIVVAVTHRDSVRLGIARGSNDPRFLPWRLADMTLLIDQLPTLLGSIPGVGKRADLSNIAIAGHSFGGLIAQTIGGATLRDPVTGSVKSYRHAAVRAALVFSGAGAMAPVLLPEDFASLEIPALITVGTRDLKQAPDLDGYTWRRQPYDYAIRGQKYLLVLDGADHYLGGSVGRDDLPRAPQADAFVRAFNSASTLFFDAELKRHRKAQRTLRALPLTAKPFAEFATLERR